MDKLGMFRRFAGLAGVILVALGVKDQAVVDSAMHNIDLLIGSAMFLGDFGYSIYTKYVGK